VRITAGSPTSIPKIEFKFDTGGGYTQEAGTVNALGTIEQPLLWLARFTPGSSSNIKLRVNGQDKTSSLTYTVDDNTSGRTLTLPIQLGVASAATYYAAEFVYVFAGEFSESECQSLEYDPYQFLRPI
jgi:hypothetical protein